MHRDQIISMRVTEADKQRLEALADARGINLSDLLRGLIAKLAEPPPTPIAPTSITVSAPATVTWFAA